MKYILLFLVLFNIALFPKEKKSIYVYKILTKNTKDPNFESKFRNKMTGILLKDFSDYNLMDDDSIAGLKAKLEKSKMFGCNEEACMREISRSLNADEVITGTIEENNGKFKYSFKNSARVKKGEENLSIKSLSDGEFSFNQWEYFTGEIVRKLMNPSYTMNYKDAPLYENLDDFNYTTVKDLKEIKLPEIKGNTLDIVKRLKEVTIADADTAYQKKDFLLSLNGFRDARDALNSLSPEDKKKAGNMATDIQNRIYMVGDAMFAERLGELETYYKENSPMSLKAVKKSKGLDGWLYLFTDYSKTLEEGERNPVTEKRIAKRSVELAERRYRLLMEEEEKSGDEKLAVGKYDSAISYYEDALDIIKNSQGLLGERESSSLGRKLADAKARRWNPEMDKQYAEIEKKSEELWKDGEYADYIDYLKEKVSKLEELKAKGANKVELISNTTAKVNQYPERLKAEEKSISNKISLYSDAAKVDVSYTKKLEREKEKDTFLKKEIFEKELPTSFTTKSGIKFTKILMKDGKPVYVSERIRPNEMDTWYFARDFAEKLKKEDNCPDCYRLPYFEEIVNLQAEPGKRRVDYNDGRLQEYEGLWLKSWSPAPVGMTLGNIPFLQYSIDFIHDVVFHPLTWQSYLYPISPDSVAASRGGSWAYFGRSFRCAARDFFDVNLNYGFRLIRPLRNAPIESNLNTNNNSEEKRNPVESDTNPRLRENMQKYIDTNSYKEEKIDLEEVVDNRKLRENMQKDIDTNPYQFEISCYSKIDDVRLELKQCGSKLKPTLKVTSRKKIIYNFTYLDFLNDTFNLNYRLPKEFSFELASKVQDDSMLLVVIMKERLLKDDPNTGKLIYGVGKMYTKMGNNLIFVP